jgi:hypothetical protein
MDGIATKDILPGYTDRQFPGMELQNITGKASDLPMIS